MARLIRFTFLCNEFERTLIDQLADQLKRSRSDAVRFVVAKEVKSLSIQYLGNQMDIDSSGLNSKEE